MSKNIANLVLFLEDFCKNRTLYDIITIVLCFFYKNNIRKPGCFYKMNTSLIRKIIASDLPRKEQDLLILLVSECTTDDQKKKELNSYYGEECNESKSESDSEPESETKEGNDCTDYRAQYKERHGRILSGSELAAHVSAEKSISHDHSKVWGLQFPSNTIWGNWVYSYNKEDEAQ